MLKFVKIKLKGGVFQLLRNTKNMIKVTYDKISALNKNQNFHMKIDFRKGDRDRSTGENQNPRGVGLEAMIFVLRVFPATQKYKNHDKR